MRRRAVADGVRLAVGTLTIIPVRPPTLVDAAAARVAMLAGWMVALAVTLPAAGLASGLVWLGVPAGASGLVAVGLLQLLTRAIHADGLADTVDGLGASWERERALSVMHSGDVGPMGVVALIVVLGGQALLVGQLAGVPWGWVVAGVALALGRLGLVVGAGRGVPAARPDGLGAAVAGSVPRLVGALSWVAGVAVALLAGWAAGLTLVGHADRCPAGAGRHALPGAHLRPTPRRHHRRRAGRAGGGGRSGLPTGRQPGLRPSARDAVRGAAARGGVRQQRGRRRPRRPRWSG